MFAKLWFRIAAALVIVIATVAISAPFVADFVVRSQLESAGVSWSAISRDGLSWRMNAFSRGAVSASEARFTLSSKPRLALRDANLDLHQLLHEPAAATLSPPPAWVYIAADPLSLSYGDQKLATGMRGRLSAGRLVASGPTMNLKGQWRDALQMDLDGDIMIGAVRFDGALRATLRGGVELQVMPSRFEQAKGDALLAADISAQVSGDSVSALAGKVFAGKTEASLEVNCAPDASGCVLAVSPAGHPFSDLLARWPGTSSEAPLPVGPNARVSFEFAGSGVPKRL